MPRILLLLSCIILILLREPALIMHPRLWAEEGRVFYSFAQNHSVWEIITTPLVGYSTLFNSMISVVQAKMLQPESVAIFSTWAGFIVQLIPVSIIIFTTHKFWDTYLKKIVCVIIIIALTPPELYLNTTNSHFIFGLITFLIVWLKADELNKYKKYVFRVLLFIGGLSGPASMFFTPLLLVKAWLEKSRERAIQAAILSLCSLVQVGVIIYSLTHNNQYNRLAVNDMNVTVQHFFIDNFSLNLLVLGDTWAAIFGIIIMLVCVYLIMKHRRNTDYILFFSGFIIIAVFSTLGSLNMVGSPRYAYIPTCMLMILFASEFLDAKTNYRKLGHLFVALIFSASLAINIIYYKPAMQQVYKPELPEWKDEVAKWRMDATYQPKIHPHDPHWKVQMYW